MPVVETGKDVGDWKMENTAEREPSDRSIKRRIRYDGGEPWPRERVRSRLRDAEREGFYAFAKPFPPVGWDLYIYYPPETWERKMYGKPSRLTAV